MDIQVDRPATDRWRHLSSAPKIILLDLLMRQSKLRVKLRGSIGVPCARRATRSDLLAQTGEKMKLVKIVAVLVETVALVFVLAGCPSDTCSTAPDGSVSCNGGGGGGGGGSDIGNDNPDQRPAYEPYHPPEDYKP